MVDWTSSMIQTYEFYEVDPDTWKDIRRLDNVVSCKIERDSTSETLGSATIDVTESLGECYIRIYLITIQNGETEKHPLGTYLAQTPSSNYDGMVRTVSMDAYTPLLELKEKPTPLGYSLLKDENIVDRAYQICRDNMRAPVVKTTNAEKLTNHFVSNASDTWLTYVTDLLATAKYVLSLDEMGRLLFAPKQDTASLQAVWTYDDSNSSILYPEIEMSHDIYGIPNVVEVVYSDGQKSYFARAVNDDENNPLSTVNRGREILHRITNPSIPIDSTGKQVQDYAEQKLKELSSVEFTLTYTHGYCPVRVGDCVRLNYERAGIIDVKARVISQSISCEPGCPVSEKAVFTNKLWG